MSYTPRRIASVGPIMKYFTPYAANRMLPLVRRIAADLADLQGSLGARRERIDKLDTRGLVMSTAHEEELADVRLTLQTVQARIADIENELASLGVIIHSAEFGAIDFPSFHEGREVRLCWKLGEENVSFWHEVRGTLLSRQPIGECEFTDTPQPATGDAPVDCEKPGSIRG
jgi:hypothetical protein